MSKNRSLLKELVLLQRSIPSCVLSLFAVSVVAMNLLANKSIDTPFSWLALDCGVLFSWLAFLLMDMITRRFGPRASTLASFMALGVNLFMAFMFFIAAKVPGNWGESFSGGDAATVNTALNNTFGGTWYVLFGSSVAFIVSALVNNITNSGIGKKLQNRTFKDFALRSYVSTFVSQFADNLTFSLIVSHNFFGWSLGLCFTCALTGALIELLCEVVFSPLGYRVSLRWDNDEVGKEYLDYIGKEFS